MDTIFLPREVSKRSRELTRGEYRLYEELCYYRNNDSSSEQYGLSFPGRALLVQSLGMNAQYISGLASGLIRKRWILKEGWKYRLLVGFEKSDSQNSADMSESHIVRFPPPNSQKSVVKKSEKDPSHIKEENIEHRTISSDEVTAPVLKRKPKQIDEPYEIFKSGFYGKYGEAYVDKGGDWPNYDRFKKARDRAIEPKEWRLACDNFFASPESHTLRHFCSIYAQCKHGLTDGYGKLVKPIETPKPINKRDMAVDTSFEEMEEINKWWAENKAKGMAARGIH